jgi:hypothetical protein
VCYIDQTDAGALLWKSSGLVQVIRLGSRVNRCDSGECRVIRWVSPGVPAVTGMTGDYDRYDRCGLSATRVVFSCCVLE